MVFSYPSAQNTFIPDHEATGKLVVEFARNPKDFAVARYTQVVPVKKVAGYFLRMTIEEAARIVNVDGSDHLWADGQPAPEFNDGTESFEWSPYRTTRYAFGFNLGDLTIDQASWQILTQHARIKAQKAMTFRTLAALTQFTTVANYAATHTSAVGAIPSNSGRWDQSTTARSDIQRSLNFATDIIIRDTNGAIDPDNLVLVVSPTCARQIKESQEIVDAIKQSPDALAQVRGELPNANVLFGLPAKLFGIPVVVEKTVRVTTRKGAATVGRAYACPVTTPFLCSRPGGLEGVEGAPNFSTVVIFALEEMTVETLRDNPNRRTTGRVVENFDVVMTAPVSGFLFTDAVAAA